MTDLEEASLVKCLVYERSTARNEQFRSNGSMASALRSTMSLFPISTMVPPSAQILHEASSSSPIRELRITSTPRPLVTRRISWAKSVFRDEKIRSGGMPKVWVRKSRFSCVPTVAKISAFLYRASWTAASPTPPQAEWIKTDCEESELALGWSSAPEIQLRFLTCPSAKLARLNNE